MDNMKNDNVIQEQIEQQNEEIVFNYSDTPVLKPLFELSKRDTTFALCALVASIFAAVFGIFGGFAFGYLLSIAFMVVLFGVYFTHNKKVGILPIIFGLLSVANSAVFICTTNGSVRFFGVVVSLLLSLVFFDGVVNGNQSGNRQTASVIYKALSTVGNAGISLKSLLLTSKGEKKIVGKVMLGLLCAIPVLAVVVPLLISSDDAFSGMMSSIFSNSGNTFLTILKIVFGAIVSMFVISYGFSLKYNRTATTKESKFKGIESICIISFLSAIALCYLLYLFSQLAYFFSAFSGFLPNDKITYSQYARKGFFEMCVIAVINLGVVFLSMLLAKKQNGKVSVGIKITATFISVFTLIIIATAISKMVLYINEFGMTVLRVTTSAFMVFLAVVFIAVILRIYINKINIVKTSLITAGIVVLLLGTVNVNALCARYNYESYKEGRLDTIDIETLYNLGDEGIPYVVKLAYSKNKVYALQAQEYLVRAYMEDYFVNMLVDTRHTNEFDVKVLRDHQKYKSFSYFSIPKSHAYDALYKFLEKNPDFSSYCCSKRHDFY